MVPFFADAAAGAVAFRLPDGMHSAASGCETIAPANKPRRATRRLLLGSGQREVGSACCKLVRLGTISGILMICPKRLQAYPIACRPCMTAPGGWAGY